MPSSFNQQSLDTFGQLNANANGAQTETTLIPARTTGDNTETVIFSVPTGASACVVSRISVISATAITGAATNFQTLSVRKVHGTTPSALSGSAVLATTASQAAFTEKVLFSGTYATTVTLQPGDKITLRDVSSGSGAVLPEMSAMVEFQPSYQLF